MGHETCVKGVVWAHFLGLILKDIKSVCFCLLFCFVHGQLKDILFQEAGPQVKGSASTAVASALGPCLEILTEFCGAGQSACLLVGGTDGVVVVLQLSVERRLRVKGV